jgi:hypothetical protein
MRRASLKDAVPVRESPAPMTWSLVPGWGEEGWFPISKTANETLLLVSCDADVEREKGIGIDC